MSTDVARRLVETYRLLAAERLLPLSSGNLSVRQESRILITPTGADATLAEADLVSIDFDGNAAGNGIPSSEWAMHAAIYRARPEAQAVVHTHGDACTAVSCHRRALPAFHYMIASFGGDDVPCAAYAPFGSAELARNAAAALGKRSACLLANHGMICFGTGIEAAGRAALKLEMLARQYLLSCALGDPILLGAADMAEVARRYGFYGRSYIPETQPPLR